EFSLLFRLLPYLEQGTIYKVYQDTFGTGTFGSEFRVDTFLSPADPTIMGGAKGSSSYAANALVFGLRMRMSQVFRDGMSNTIGFAEHYAGCSNGHFNWFSDELRKAFRRATFADAEAGDVYPITQGNPPVSRPSVAG